MKKLFPLLALVLGGSGLVQTVMGVINGASASSIPVPKDSSGAAGYFYTKLPTKPGQTLTLNYTITGNNPVWQQHPQPGGTDRATPLL